MGMLKSHCGKVDPATAALYGLAGFGLLSALSVATSALRFLWRKHLRPGKKLRKYGEWALVTGASDGIGRAYCNYLAKQGESSNLQFETCCSIHLEACLHTPT